MPSLVESAPDYPEKVQAYLDKWHMRRLPHGTIVAHGHMVGIQTRGRYEIGEVAIALLAGLGVDETMLAALNEALPWNVTPEQAVTKFRELRDGPPASDAPAASTAPVASVAPPASTIETPATPEATS